MRHSGQGGLHTTPPLGNPPQGEHSIPLPLPPFPLTLTSCPHLLSPPFPPTSGWASWWLAPWLVFHGWLSLLGLASRAAPHAPYYPPGPETYDLGRAALAAAVTLTLPSWLGAAINHFHLRLPHLADYSVPFYRLPEAQAWLVQRLGPYLTQTALTVRLVTNIITVWQVRRGGTCGGAWRGGDGRGLGSGEPQGAGSCDGGRGAPVGAGGKGQPWCRVVDKGWGRAWRPDGVGVGRGVVSRRERPGVLALPVRC